ncbi:MULTISPECIES: hypothetical protein [Novosphingobium]|uniref:Uncharacterized protein n=1 Tax=Novosphingobium pentaromativorans TaxID=205844 RepID=A0A2W5QJC4_9SPHN|nr:MULTISPECIES: hypothetical protein [Novosphingobium]PZQ54813.1 MAG: hypothetical protein DI555_12420 [Novosphingobium pentaromativorans]GFE75535.1 hypothetical protein NTCA1_31840 [Novosphingobium sp. TCA1]
MTPVERGMQALAVALGAGDWEALDSASRERFAGAAHAMLEAMREPDALMMEAGAEIVRHVHEGESEEAYRNDAANIWRFMIAAAVAQD